MSSNIQTELEKRDILRMSNAESKKLTRDCIQTALMSLMSSIPYEKITITSIIKRSGVSRAGFYRNYSNKDEILKDIGKKIKYQIESSFSSREYNGNMRDWYLGFFQKLYDHKEEVNLFIQAKIPPDFIFQAYSRFLKHIENHSALDKYRAIVFNNGIMQVVIHWFNYGLVETPEEMADICLQLFSSIL